jgi:transcription elongation GreA/GreB family factor
MPSRRFSKRPPESGAQGASSSPLQRLIVTAPSLQSMAENMDHHAAEKRSAQREAKVAKEWGDLSENAEYKASKEKFRLAGRLQQRFVREFKKLESTGYVVVNPVDWVKASAIERVQVGTVVSVTQGRFTEEYLVVGAKDQNLPMDGSLVPVPYTSPLGAALVGRRAGEKVDAAIAGERRVLGIGTLRAPTLDEVLHFYPELTPE